MNTDTTDQPIRPHPGKKKNPADLQGRGGRQKQRYHRRCFDDPLRFDVPMRGTRRKHLRIHHVGHGLLERLRIVYSQIRQNLAIHLQIRLPIFPHKL